MYSTQGLYFHDHFLLDAMQRIGNAVAGFLKILGNGVTAARAAQLKQTDRETLLAILSEE